MEIDGPDGKFWVGIDDSGYYVYIMGQKVRIEGSPVVIHSDPEIFPPIDLGAIYQMIKSKLP